MIGEIEFQKDYVLSQIKRIINFQDSSIFSKSSGSFHYAYWRDKTSEFADARFQEAGATLGLALHDQIYTPKTGVDKNTLHFHFNLALKFWERCQNNDGSFDEWYKNEHGFAATAFTLFAYGIAFKYCGHLFTDEEWSIYKKVSKKCVKWFETKDDVFKHNHQIVAVAALGITSINLNDTQIMKMAKAKLHLALEGQSDEGWFREISGVDLGYGFLILDYYAYFMHFTEDREEKKFFNKLYSFLIPFMGDKLSIPGSFGICLNPYVSTIASFVFDDKKNNLCIHSQIKKTILQENQGMTLIRPYLSDDLRLSRWSCLPILNYLISKDFSLNYSLNDDFDTGIKYKKIYTDSKLVVLQSKEKLCFSAPTGGQVAVTNEGKWLYDYGYLLEIEGKKYLTGGYNHSRALNIQDESAESEVFFYAVKHAFPNFITRFTLRLVTSIPGAPYYVRKLIDMYRKNKGTALNQSAAPISSKKIDAILRRRVDMSLSDSFQIEDEIRINLSFKNFKLYHYIREESGKCTVEEVNNAQLSKANGYSLLKISNRKLLNNG